MTAALTRAEEEAERARATLARARTRDRMERDRWMERAGTVVTGALLGYAERKGYTLEAAGLDTPTTVGLVCLGVSVVMDDEDVQRLAGAASAGALTVAAYNRTKED